MPKKKIDDVKSFMVQWNNKFPLDYWWRKKHSISFLSEEHKSASFISQLMEYEEEKLYLKQNKVSEEQNYIPNIGDFLKKKVYSSVQEELNDTVNEMKAELNQLKEGM